MYLRQAGVSHLEKSLQIRRLFHNSPSGKTLTNKYKTDEKY